MVISDNDGRSRRCPMLGHVVEFGFCRQYTEGKPCRKIFDCWWETFEVVDFVTSHYTEEEVAAITRPPTDRIVNIYELIRKAQEAAAESSDHPDDKEHKDE